MKTPFLIFFLIATCCCFGQKTDYIVKQNGDTIYGDISLKKKNFVVSGPDGDQTLLNATDVKTASLKKYNGTIVLPCVLHTYTDNMYLLERNSFSSQNLDTVLILSEVYTTPKMNLYWCKDNNKSQYYFYKTPFDTLPVQLYVNYSFGGGASAASELKSTGLASRNHIEVQKGYVNQLKFIMGNCKKISEGVWELLDYRIYSFKDLIRRYNKCK